MSSKSSSDLSRSARDAKLEQIRKQNAADKRRQRIIALVTAGIIVVLAGVVGVVIWQAAREEATLAGADPGNLTTVTSTEGNDVSGFAVGPADAAATVTLFEDFLCPACQAFENAFGTYIAGLPDQGVRVVYSPVTILDARSAGTRYSSRAASAVACVAEQDDGDLTQTRAFTDLLFINQPGEGSSGLESAVLADYAVEAGAPESAQFRSCIESDTYQGWTDRATEAAQAAGLAGTPTVWVNGAPVESSQQAIQAAIDAAGGGTGGQPSGGASGAAPAEPSAPASN